MGEPHRMGDTPDVLDCFEALPTPVWAFEGAEHRVVAANRAARASVGNRPQIVGLPVREVIPEVSGQQLFEQLDWVYATGETVSGREWRILIDADCDGLVEEAFCDLVLAPRFAADGSVHGVLVHGVDVTASVQRREAEADVVDTEQPVPGGTLALQRATLPAGLPVLPQVRLAARYLAAGEEAAAGGDWFDAVPLPDGRVALTVGDVVGHGAPAAAVMGQLRAVLSEALGSGVPAAEALVRLDRYAGRVSAARAATCLLAVIDGMAGRVEYGGFGHPAPLVVADAGRTRFLPVPPSDPLGVGGKPPALRSARLVAGEVLLLYSDGLLGRPGRSLPEAMEDLARVASAALWEVPMTPQPGPLADRVCELAVERLTRTGYRDDVTVIGAELRAGPHRPLALELPAEARWLRGIRRALDDWLHGVGAAGDDVPAVHLAVVEAATNCIEHAYRDNGGWMWLDAVLDSGGRLRVTVTDHGTWRTPTPAPVNRGRGLRLMHSLMDSVEVQRSARGTTVTMLKTLQHPTVFLPGFTAAATAESVPHDPAVAGTPAAGTPATGTRAGSIPLDHTPEFSTEVRAGPRPRLVVTGRVDHTTAGALENRISEVSQGGVQALDVDLSAVTQLASAGVQVLYDHTNSTGQTPDRLRLLVPEGCPARFVLELTGLTNLLAHPSS